MGWVFYHNTSQLSEYSPLAGPPFTNPTVPTNDFSSAPVITPSMKMDLFRLPLKKPSLKPILIWKLPKKNWLLLKLKSPKDPKSKKPKLKSPLRLSKLCSSKLFLYTTIGLINQQKL